MISASYSVNTRPVSGNSSTFDMKTSPSRLFKGSIESQPESWRDNSARRATPGAQNCLTDINAPDAVLFPTFLTRTFSDWPRHPGGTVDRPHFLHPIESSHLDRGALEIYSRASVILKLHQVQPFASPTAMNCGSGPRFSPQ